ncbi:MAG: hypothetical protein QF541_15735 [Lentisphaeria bacterium]|jgi:hypothetical protein|nr:hypothetical protein [Lentisphaeria bacterium]
MNRHSIYALCLLFVTCQAPAKSLIISATGRSIWAAEVRKDGDTLIYTTTNGTEASMPVKGAKVVPGVVRGKRYRPEFIERVITLVDGLSDSHPHLKKQLRPLHDEWQVLKTGTDETAGAAVQEALDTFNAGSRDYAAYNAAMTDLGMIDYKDVQGRFTDQTQAAIAKVKTGYHTVGLARLRKLVAQGSASIETYRQLKLLADELLLTKPPKAAAQETRTLRTTAKKQAIKGTMQTIKAARRGDMTIEIYLQCRGLLTDLRKYVIDSGKATTEIDEKLADLVAEAGRRLPGYGFKNDGFPLHRDDHKLIKQVAPFYSQATPSSLQIDRQAFLIGETMPPTVRRGRDAELAFRVVFNRLPPDSGRFGIFIYGRGSRKGGKYVVPIREFKIHDGHGRAVIHDDFTRIDERVVKRQAPGKFNVFAFLAHTDERDPSPADWRILSAGCPLPVRP